MAIIHILPRRRITLVSTKHWLITFVDVFWGGRVQVNAAEGRLDVTLRKPKPPVSREALSALRPLSELVMGEELQGGREKERICYSCRCFRCSSTVDMGHEHKLRRSTATL